ncbi:ImmA/IrrE family metallo-endopeptidase [Bifidobacterium sp. ESL0790]|uniref:ImmA/IrrE family metallo-endopeptidase n=1 Tax=Bifidobacterium sp. ESL0790 TaxID=2983233 RepID=UPI0023F77A92|nr:ImmA/IrrE family metallo-endopeptidase [Bifidobacterium sp. ESL0790]WEV71914.1 ImmA/IrrE family metallo-endopeptidase [Bifidobacterium sp. ESL0790]
MAQITVQPATLRWAVSQSGHDVEAIASRPGLTQLPQWLQAKRPISLSFTKISDLSKALQIPFGRLVRTSVPPTHEDELVKFRTLNNNAAPLSKSLEDIIAKMRIRQTWAHDEMMSLGLGTNTFVGSLHNTRSAKEIAQSIIQALQLPERWTFGKSDRKRFNFLREMLSNVGIMTMVDSEVAKNEKLDIQEFRAFTLLDDIAPLIFINRNDSDKAMLFSLLHELTHIFLGAEELFNATEAEFDISDQERLINQTVMEIILGDSDFRKEWLKESKTKSSRIEVAETFSSHYGLSALSFLIKAKQEGLASERDIEAEYTQLAQVPPKRTTKNDGGNQNITNSFHLDSRFVSLVEQGINSNSISYTDGFSLLGLKSERAYDGLLAAKGMNDGTTIPA